MRKAAATFLLMIALCCTLCACNKDSEGSGNAAYDKIGQVSVHSGGEAYNLTGNWEFAYSDNGDGTGLSSDGERAKLQDIAAECVEIACDGDFRILFDGQHHDTIAYTLYNEQFEEIGLEFNRLERPFQEGIYYLCIGITWGDYKNYSGYLKYCKIIVQN